MEVLKTAVNLPTSGMLLLFEKKAKWRKDGHQWVTRSPTSPYTREDRVTLKGKTGNIKCAYTYGRKDSTITSASLKRRAYWFETGSNSVLVHYLDTDQEVTSSNETSSKQTVSEPSFDLSFRSPFSVVEEHKEPF